MQTHKLLNLVPENTTVEMSGPDAAEFLSNLYPPKKVSDTCIEDIHMMLFGNTKRISKPIINKSK